MNKASKTIVNIPVLSCVMNEGYVQGFLQGSKKGDIFGYSDLFTLEQIKDKAERYGVLVDVLPKSNPLRKKYGEYVVRVIKPFTPVAPKRIAQFIGLRSMEIKASPGKRKCVGLKCSNTISRGKLFLETTDLKNVLNKTVVEKKSYCLECGDQHINFLLIKLLKLKGHSDSSVRSILNSINILR